MRKLMLLSFGVILISPSLVVCKSAIARSDATVTTGPAHNVTSVGATLTGTVDPDGTSTVAQFQYGTTTSYGSATSWMTMGAGTTTVGASQPIAGLRPSTTYHYRIVGKDATNSAGVVRGADAAFTTATVDTSPPSTPTGLVASGQTSSSITLSWKASTDNVGVTGYNT